MLNPSEWTSTPLKFDWSTVTLVDADVSIAVIRFRIVDSIFVLILASCSLNLSVLGLIMRRMSIMLSKIENKRDCSFVELRESVEKISATCSNEPELNVSRVSVHTCKRVSIYCTLFLNSNNHSEKLYSLFMHYLLVIILFITRGW